MTLKLGDPAGAKRDSARDMLKNICPEADLQVADEGTVTTKEADFCTRRREKPLSPGCKCICDAIGAGKTITILVQDDLSAFGGGRTDDAVPDDTANGKGSDETVNIENKNRWRAKDPKTDNWVDDPDWVILAHELCGHAVPGAKGTHPEWRPGRKGYDPNWHDSAFNAEDEIREENGLPKLGSHSPSKKP